MSQLNFTERCLVNAISVRDLYPGAHVLATVDGMFFPMRVVAFGDLNFDRVADLPLIFSDAGEAHARAAHWNDRMPEQYRPALEISAMPVAAWAEAYVGALDPAEAFDPATSIDFTPPDAGDVHPEAAEMVAEDFYEEA